MNWLASDDDNQVKQKSDAKTPITRSRVWVTMFGALAIVYLLWNIPALDFIVYPLRLFVTYVHEAGHSSMALLSGGKVVGFSVSSDGSGLARTIGGTRALILLAGYLGAAFFGACLFYIVNTFRRPRSISIVIGVMMVFFTLSFASVDASGAPFAMLIGLGMSAVLIGMGWKLNRQINLLVLNVLAIMTSLNAVLDLFFLVNNADVGAGQGVRNDAAAFSEVVNVLGIGLPAAVWAFVWAGIAIAMIGAAVYYSLIRPTLNDAVKDAEKPKTGIEL